MNTDYGRRNYGGCGYMGRSSLPPPAPSVADLKREVADKIKAKQAEIALLQAQLEILSRLN